MPNQPACYCRPDCPHYGQPNDNVYLIQCECGEEEMLCGYCIAEGRISACRECTARKAESN